jgi:hypothetical protein
MLIYDKKTGTVLDARYCVFIDDYAGDRFEVPPTPEEWVYIADDVGLPVVTAYNIYMFITDRLPDLLLSFARDTDGHTLDPWEV